MFIKVTQEKATLLIPETPETEPAGGTERGGNSKPGRWWRGSLCTWTASLRSP